MHRRLLPALSLLTLTALLGACGADQVTRPLTDDSSKGVVTATGGDSSQTKPDSVVTGGGGSHNPPPPSPVSSFDFTAQIRGSLAGADTSKSEIVPGATVKLVRRGGVKGDTLAAGIDAGTAVSDASGFVSFKGLTGGWYEVDITPPNGSPYGAMLTGFGPPVVSDVHTNFVLRKR